MVIHCFVMDYQRMRQGGKGTPGVGFPDDCFVEQSLVCRNLLLYWCSKSRAWMLHEFCLKSTQNTKISNTGGVMMAKHLAVAGVATLFAFWGLAAQAVTLSFFCITNNNAGNCGIGEAQLTVDVTDLGSGSVNFRFNNSGPAVSSITEVYFDDGTLLGLSSVLHSAGDPWTGGSASPPNLPGGNLIDPPFVATAGFLAESDPPPPHNGVRPGEWLDVIFALNGTYSDVIDELTDGRLRIGMHVIAFSSGGSESFVNNPVPVPAAVWLLGSGLLGLVGVARRRKV
jgi:hypothetical protein